MQSEDVNCLKVASGKGLNVYAQSLVKRRKGVHRTTRGKSWENRALGDGSAEAMAQSWDSELGPGLGWSEDRTFQGRTWRSALWINPDRPVGSDGDLGGAHGRRFWVRPNQVEEGLPVLKASARTWRVESTSVFSVRHWKGV